jgi:DNA repair protein RecO (recombination protein O)
MTYHFSTIGFVFKKENKSEADQLFSIYTKDFGRLEILGKGIRKITAKLRSKIDLFYIISFRFVQGKTNKILIEAKVLKKFNQFKENLQKLQVAFKMIEILDKTLAKEEKDERIFKLILECFQTLEKMEDNLLKIKLIYYYFFWNLLSFLGYKPQLSFCVNCQRKIFPPKTISFCPSEGGIVCNFCVKKFKNCIPISLNELKTLKLLLEKRLNFVLKLRINTFFLSKLSKISKAYFSNFVEKYEQNL